jgi:glycerol kinase
MGFHILSIDQGTTSTRAMIFDAASQPQASAQRELKQIYPQAGWVEHDGNEIWAATVEVCNAVLAKSPVRPKAIGIANQRETTLVWDRATGAPIANAIVWQDRRTAGLCAALKAEGVEPELTKRTGLLLDPYFSATKIAWLLDHIPGARDKAEKGELAFGTIDSFLLWRLTGGRVHATDATNAARTLLYNIHEGEWDPWLLKLFNIPQSLLPDVHDCAYPYGETDAALFGQPIPITGIAGDQQAAAIGQACFEPGMIKSTYGTGCFILMNTGAVAVRSARQLLTTVAYRLGGQTTFALEGSIFSAGSAVQWLRDGLKLITNAGETEALAAGLDSNKGVYMVPAFTGLGAPHWDATARGALYGLARDTGVAELARAILESVAYQTHDLIGAMLEDAYSNGLSLDNLVLRADGGMVGNVWMMQFLADILATRVDRPLVLETTALGAAYLAGLGAGLYGSLDEIAIHRKRDRLFTPEMDADKRLQLIAGWRDALNRTLTRPA